MINTTNTTQDPATRQTLSRVCDARDWNDHSLVELMADIAGSSDLGSRPHRKLWEFAWGIRALTAGGALTEDAIGLSVGAGHEAILYYLTNHCRWLIATDIYGTGEFSSGESSGAMLFDPDLFAPYPYRKRRLTVAYMDALDLRFEDDTFDFVISFGSIEHFGGRSEAAQSLAEIARVLKPGGVAFITTEILVDHGEHVSLPALELFTPDTLRELATSEPRMRWLGRSDFTVLEANVSPIPLSEEIPLLQAGRQSYSHLRISVNDGARNRIFTSASLALTKEST